MTSTKRRFAARLGHFSRLTTLLLVCSIVLSLGSAVAVRADGEDQRRALAALKAGQIVPLREMLDEIETLYSGDVLEVELDDKRVRGRRIWIYKIKLLTPQGNVLKIRIDAKTKEILRIKGRGAEQARKK